MRILFINILVSLVVLCSCNSSNSPEIMQEDNNVKEVRVRFIPMVDEDTQSRIALQESGLTFFWEKNDTLGIFPSRGGQVEFPIKEEYIGTDRADFDGGGWALKLDASYSAYYPFNFYNRNLAAIPHSYVGQIKDGNVAEERAHLSRYIFGASVPTMPKENNKLLSFDLMHVGTSMKLTLNMPEANSYDSLTVYTDAKILPIKKTINLQDGSLTQTPVEYSDRLTVGLKNVSTVTPNEELVIWVVFPSVKEPSHELKVVVYGSNKATYTGSLYKKNNDGTTTPAMASCTAGNFQRRYATLEYNPNFTLGVTSITPEQWQNGGEENVTVTIP